MRLPGRLLELRGDAHPRGMTVQDRTRLNGRLFSTARGAGINGAEAAPDYRRARSEREDVDPRTRARSGSEREDVDPSKKRGAGVKRRSKKQKRPSEQKNGGTRTKRRNFAR